MTCLQYLRIEVPLRVWHRRTKQPRGRSVATGQVATLVFKAFEQLGEKVK